MIKLKEIMLWQDLNLSQFKWMNAIIFILL